MLTTELPTLDVRALPKEKREATILDRIEALKGGESLILILPHHPGALLQKMIEEFPLRFDFSPVEQGPAWKYHVFARHSATPRTIKDYLAWDHDRLDAMLVEALDHAKRGDWTGSALLADNFRTGLFRHIEIEEGVLFPAFDERTGMGHHGPKAAGHDDKPCCGSCGSGGPTMVMRMEHVDIKAAVEDFCKAAKAKDLDGMQRAKADILDVLVDHNMKEEQILYPGTDNLLDEAALDALVVRLLLG